VGATEEEEEEEEDRAEGVWAYDYPCTLLNNPS
jgi:hypothetical protein